MTCSPLVKVKGVAGIAVVSLNEAGHLVCDESPLEKVQVVKLEVDVATDEVVDIIVRTSRARDGHPGDGKVLVSRSVRAVLIEDGATDENAFQRTSAVIDFIEERSKEFLAIHF